MSSWQVTIVTNSVPAVGGDSGEARCQGDMEKADMVDGKKLNVSCSFSKFLGWICCPESRVSPGIKESVCWTPPPEVNPNKTCEYQALCSRFKDLLTLPGEFPAPAPHFPRGKRMTDSDLFFLEDGYFNDDTKYNLCYCESCHKLRGDEAYYKKGEPPRDYALPFGWCRFALR